MARIRTIKPDFFRHELLQDLEQTYPDKHPMMVFAGLFGHCDRLGRFLWRPRQLKLDILPFMIFDMAETLTVLEQARQIVRYSLEGIEYGWIPTFTQHQRISGKEAKDPAKYPDPPREVIEQHKRSSGEALGQAGREGKGREGNGEHAVSTAPVDKTERQKQTGGAWWKTDAGIESKGQELGVKPRPGESWQEFKERLFSEHVNAPKRAAA